MPPINFQWQAPTRSSKFLSVSQFSPTLSPFYPSVIHLCGCSTNYIVYILYKYITINCKKHIQIIERNYSAAYAFFFPFSPQSNAHCFNLWANKCAHKGACQHTRTNNRTRTVVEVAGRNSMLSDPQREQSLLHGSF